VLLITGTDPIGTIPTDGVWFQQTDGSANVVLKVVKNSTATTATVGTITAATDIELAFYYNGKDGIQAWVDGVYVDTLAVTNLPDDEELTVMFGCQNGSGAARTMNLDYVLAIKER